MNTIPLSLHPGVNPLEVNNNTGSGLMTWLGKMFIGVSYLGMYCYIWINNAFKCIILDTKIINDFDNYLVSVLDQ